MLYPFKALSSKQQLLPLEHRARFILVIGYWTPTCVILRNPEPVLWDRLHKLHRPWGEKYQSQAEILSVSQSTMEIYLPPLYPRSVLLATAFIPLLLTRPDPETSCIGHENFRKVAPLWIGLNLMWNLIPNQHHEARMERNTGKCYNKCNLYHMFRQ